MWCLPGGLVDYGETIEEAAGREIREECNLDLIAIKFLFYQDSLPAEDGEMHGVNFYLECRTSGNLKLNAESSAHAWVSRSQLENYDLAFKNMEGLFRYFNEFR